MRGQTRRRPRAVAATGKRRSSADRGGGSRTGGARRAALLRALQTVDEISITVKGRRTRKAITLPVWFALDGDTLWLLPVQGSRSQWFRNVRADPTVTIGAARARWTFAVKPSGSRKIVREVVRRFRARYGAADVARYYSGFNAAVRVPL